MFPVTVGTLLFAAFLVAPGRGFPPTRLSQTADPVSATLGHEHQVVTSYVLKSAEEVPDSDYAFRPTPAVRSYSELLAHVAAAEYEFCAAAKGEPSPASGDDAYKHVTKKSEVIALLRKAFGYCDAVYASAHDAGLTQPITLFGTKSTRVAALVGNISDTNLHYGNIITYLRLKGFVPPSSAQAGSA